METLSFVLGMSLVVVIALAIVAVIAFFKTIKLEKRIEDLNRDVIEIDAQTNRVLSLEIEQVHRSRTESEQAIYSMMDSRLDKLESKLINKK
jgi:Na+-transporting NADH:ubiquinone oxidoreductase subunit NqrC